MDTYGPIDERCSGVSGLEGSQGRSHDALRPRISRHVRASETRTGRSVTGTSSKSGSIRVTGHPRMRPTVLIILLRCGVCHEIYPIRSALRDFRGALLSIRVAPVRVVRRVVSRALVLRVLLRDLFRMPVF